MRLHVDTDLGDNPDDARALVMLLGWPGVELTGVSTVDDAGGRRAAQVSRILDLAGRPDVPVGNASLERSLDAGATVVALGPCTNLARLGRRLRGARVVLAGGWVHPPGPGLPAWDATRDTNVQRDVAAARVVAAHAALTLVPLAGSATASLRESHLPRLAASGPLGRLLANQARGYAARQGLADLARRHPALPDDLVGFQFDPVAGAVAAGWAGAVVETMLLQPVSDAAALRFEPDPAGRPTRVVTGVDGAAFAQVWLEAVERAQRR